MSSSTRITAYQSLHIQLVQNAPGDGPMRSEIRRANKYAEQNLLIKTTLCILLDYIYIINLTVLSGETHVTPYVSRNV